VKKIVASGFIVPLLALYAIWFMSYFIRSMGVKLALKTFGWFYAPFISILLVFFFMDVSYGLDPLLSGLSRQFPPFIPVLFVVFFAVSILFSGCSHSQYTSWITMTQASWQALRNRCCCTYSPR